MPDYYNLGDYLLFVGPFMLLAFWAQWKVKSNFAKYSKVPLRSGMSGAEAAAMILRAAGIHDVSIHAVPGMLADHYNPKRKMVCLSENVIDGRSAAAVAVAAHEVGHALQDAQHYKPMELRSALVPVVNLISQAAGPMFLFGLFVAGYQMLMWAAVILYSATTLFHLVTLPVEFDASNRAIKILGESGMVDEDEMVGVKKTLYAAGFTYLAATLVSLAQLIYWVLRSRGSSN